MRFSKKIQRYFSIFLATILLIASTTQYVGATDSSPPDDSSEQDVPIQDPPEQDPATQNPSEQNLSESDLATQNTSTQIPPTDLTNSNLTESNDVSQTQSNDINQAQSNDILQTESNDTKKLVNEIAESNSIDNSDVNIQLQSLVANGLDASNTIEPRATTTTIYVAGVASDGWDTGSDSAGDGTQSKPYATLRKAASTVSSTSPGTIIVLNDITMNEQIDDNNKSRGKEYTICGESASSPPTIYVSDKVGAAAAFHIARFPNGDASIKTTMRMENIIVDGTSHTSGNFGDFFINNMSEFILGPGTILRNFKTRAINIRSGGIVTMLPGSCIENCTAGANESFGNSLLGAPTHEGMAYVGAAVYICEGGTFNMQGGTITDNRATGDIDAADIDPIAGIYAEAGTTITMQGECIVRENYYCTNYDDSSSNAKETNLYLIGSGTSAEDIQLTGALTESASIGVYLQTVPTDTTVKQIAIGTTSASSYSVVESDASYFVPDQPTEAFISYDATNARVVAQKPICRIGDTYYLSIKDAVAAVPVSSTKTTTTTIEMLSDYTITSKIEIQGKKINLTSEASSVYTIQRGVGYTDMLFEMENAEVHFSNLIIDGNRDNQVAQNAMIVASNSLLHIEDGCILQNAQNSNIATTLSGGAVYLKADATAYLETGTSIKNCYAVTDDTSPNIAKEMGGSAILVGADANLFMRGGTITECGTQANRNYNYFSSAIAVYGLCSIDGGTFFNNYSSHGGAINVVAGGTLDISRGTFDANQAYYDGGAIMIWGSTTTDPIVAATVNISSANALEPTKIINNTSRRGGSAIGMRTGSQLTIAGATIKNNRCTGAASAYTAAIGGYSSSSRAAYINVSGSTIIRNNYAGAVGTTIQANLGANYTAADGYSLHIGALSDTADIGIYGEEYTSPITNLKNAGAQFALAGTNATAVDASTIKNLKNLHNDVDSTLVGRVGEGTAIVWGSPIGVCKIGDVDYNTLTDALIAAGNSASTDITIEMLAPFYEIDTAYEVPAGKTITLTTAAEDSRYLPYQGATGTYATLIRAYDSVSATGYTGEMLIAPATSTMILENITIDGNRDKLSALAPIIQVNGNLIINENAILQNAKNIYSDVNPSDLQQPHQGGAINLYQDAATVTMNAGSIKNSFATSTTSTYNPGRLRGGSAICIGKNTQFNMNGGEITKCGSFDIESVLDSTPTNVQSTPIAVYGNCEISDGIIHDNENSSGGAIATLNETARLTISGGSIKNNRAIKGGAIYAGGGSVTLKSGASITDNSARYTGSAICLFGAAANIKESAKLFITGGMIMNNIISDSASTPQDGVITTLMNDYPLIDAITISGNPIIKNNLNESNVQKNIYTYNTGSGMALKIANLEADAEVWIHPYDAGSTMASEGQIFADTVDASGMSISADTVTNLQTLRNDINTELRGFATEGTQVMWTTGKVLLSNTVTQHGDMQKTFAYAVTINQNATSTIHLKSGDSQNIDVNLGDTITIRQNPAAGYDTSYIVKIGDLDPVATQGKEWTYLVTTLRTEIAFTNEYIVVPVTSIHIDDGRMIWWICGLFIFSIFGGIYVQYRRRKP